MIAPNDYRHGTARGYRVGCRRQCCREAERQRQALLRAQRAERVDPDDPRHGTDSFYSNHGCRCVPCSEAHAVVMKAYRSRRPGPAT